MQGFIFFHLQHIAMPDFWQSIIYLNTLGHTHTHKNVNMTMLVWLHHDLLLQLLLKPYTLTKVHGLL